MFNASFYTYLAKIVLSVFGMSGKSVKMEPQLGAA